MVPGAGCLVWRFRGRAWSGGFAETAAAPSDGLTAEHERTRKPFGTRKVWRGCRPFSERAGRLSCPPEAAFVSFAGRPEGGATPPLCLSVSA